MKAMSAARSGSIARKQTSHAAAFSPSHDLAGLFVEDELDRHAETPGELAREIGRDSARFARHGIP